MRNFCSFQFRILLMALVILPASLKAQAYTESDLFPFDQRHLTYPNFREDLDTVSAYVAQRCIANDADLAESIRADYLEGCAFPKLIEELRAATQGANADFASRELETRDQAQFIDLEYGWVLRTPFSLSKTSHLNLLHLILVKTALQMSVSHLAALWMASDLNGSTMGRMYTLPRLSAGLERDVILARTMRYASAMLCHVNQNQMEEACVNNRLQLVVPLNAILNEFQSKSAEPTPLEIQPYVDLSTAFRNKLHSWLERHNSPTTILAGMNDAAEMRDLQDSYAALLDLPKRVHAAPISAMAVRANLHSYVNELKPIDPIFNGYLKDHAIELTAELIDIFAKIRKQLSVYY
jgi:hypothetical protein